MRTYRWHAGCKGTQAFQLFLRPCDIVTKDEMLSALDSEVLLLDVRDVLRLLERMVTRARAADRIRVPVKLTSTTDLPGSPSGGSSAADTVS